MLRASTIAATLVALALALAISIAPATCCAEVPPAPAGYSSEAEIKLAFVAGKLAPIDVTIDTPDTVTLERNIEYGTGGDHGLQLDLYTPKDNSKPRPAVLFFHGGGWSKGYRQIYHYYCVKFAEHGYIVATASYRLSGEAKFPAAVEDAKCAVRWLRTNAEKRGIDPNHIGVAGGSAGGHLALMVGYSSDVPELEGKGGNAETSSGVQAVVDLYGPTDLTTDFAKSRGEVTSFLGKKYDEAPDTYKLASPITHLTKDDPPTLILHGSIDTTVPIEQAELLVSKCKEVGVKCDYDRIEGWPHTMDLEAGVNRHCMAKMFEFFDKHLGAPMPASEPTK